MHVGFLYDPYLFVSQIHSHHADVKFYFLLFSSKIKVWDLAAALDPRAPAGTLCLRTLVVSIPLLPRSPIRCP